MALNLKYTLTSPLASEPEKSNINSAGYMMFAAEEKIVSPQSVEKIDTGVIFEMQGSYYGQIENISGKESFLVIAGVIDPGFRGSVKVALFNLTNEEQHIFKGEKIAQIIFQPILLPELILKDDENERMRRESLQFFINVEKTNPHAVLPNRFEKDSVGYDLYALKNIHVLPLKHVQVDVGITLEIEGPFYAQIRDKSGFSTKRYLHVIGGVIDSSRKTPITVDFINLSNEIQHIYANERIAQIIFLPVILPILHFAEELDMNTIRGNREFNSGSEEMNTTKKNREFRSICDHVWL